MLENYEEKMALLLDNELSVEESVDMLQQIEKSEELKLKWNRYNLTSSALKSNIYPVVDLTSRMSERLESEPTIMVSQRKKPSSYKGRVIAAALAASVTLVTVITMSNFEKPSFSKSTVPKVAVKSPTPSIDPPITIDSESPALNPRFNRYLFTHNESTYETGMQGILPYARVVSYEMSR